MSKPWGTIGAWAAEAEAEEREEEAAAAAAAAAGIGRGDAQSFPSLKEAAETKQKKKKMSLQEFRMQAALGSGGGRRDSLYDYKGLTPDEMIRLPTGPKERSPEDMHYGRLGGGFSNYGRSGNLSGRNMRDRDGDGDTSWAGGRRPYGGFEEVRRTPPPSRASEFDQPSRADEVDNWAMSKKPLPSLDSGRPGRYSSLGGGVGGGGPSRADEADNWGTGKKPIPSRSSTFGYTFRDSGPEPDRWTRGGFGDVERERPRLVLNPPRNNDGAMVEPVKTNKRNPFGAARPREEVLAEKGLDWKKLDSEIEAKKSSRPTSSQSSRPSSARSSLSEGPALQGTEGAGRSRRKVNPFGDAKPREVLLEQKGMDWRKIDMDLEHRAVDRPETEAEKNLKEEIDHLKRELQNESPNANGGSLEGCSDEYQISLHAQILSKERDLDQLIRELDDKVRFGQKAYERPGSGAGGVPGFADRPSSGSGAFEESGSREFMERPGSRGNKDVLTRRGDDRRAFQGVRERRYPGNRDMDRPRSRERW